MLDCLRALPGGCVETLGLTFVVLIAVRVFDADPWQKATLVAASSFGLLLSLFLLLQIGRVWVIVTLGTRWTTRVIVLPNTPLVKHGPYRWLKHPNYLIVCAEIAVLPLIFGQWQIALFFSLANFLVLFWRIRIENETLENTVSK